MEKLPQKRRNRIRRLLSVRQNPAYIVIGVLSVIISAVWVYQSVLRGAENAQILKGQEEINHRLDQQDAWRLVGFKTGIQLRDEDIEKKDEFIDEILAHCKQEKNGCNLPDKLTIKPAGTKYESLDALLINTAPKKKENQ